jgi:ATP-dependent Clp protease ATP-binding subunit ClpB
MAEFVFDDEQGMVRIDMSECMEKHAVARLTGGLPGYEEGGQLAEAISLKPYSMILFGEIKRTYFEVFNILLQILGGGRPADSKDQVVNFRNTLILMTSNIGSSQIMGRIKTK